jgi:glycosyltransferase involved in cell wall biosynthesis
MSEVPLPFDSAPGRWFHILLKGLAERGHRVTAFACSPRPAAIAEAAELFPAPSFDLRCFTHPIRRGVGAKLQTLARPHSYMFSDALRDSLGRELAHGFDVLHLETIWCGWLGLKHRDRALLNVHYLEEIDLAKMPPGSVLDRTRRSLARRATHRLLDAYPVISADSDRLAAAVKKIAPKGERFWLPFPIDLSLYSFDPDRTLSREPVIGLIGSFNWVPTYSAAVRLVKTIWPNVKARVPGARLMLVGYNARSALREFIDLPGVEIYENVPDSVPYFQKMDVFVYAPVTGSGVKTKVMEAMALGVPVVTNADGVEGIPGRDGRDAAVCVSDAEIIDRTVAILSDRDKWSRQRAAGRRLMELECSPRKSLDVVEKIYARIMRSREASC